MTQNLNQLTFVREHEDLTKKLGCKGAKEPPNDESSIISSSEMTKLSRDFKDHRLFTR